MRALCVLTWLCLLGCAPAPLPGLAVPSERAPVVPEQPVQQLGRVHAAVFADAVPGGYAVGLHVQNHTQRAFVIAPGVYLHELELFRAGEEETDAVRSLRWKELPGSPLDDSESYDGVDGALLRPGESLRLGTVVATSADVVALEGTLGMLLFPAARPSAVTLRRFHVELPLPQHPPDKGAEPGGVASGSPTVEAGYVVESHGHQAIGVRVRNTTAAPVVLTAWNWLMARFISFPDGSSIGASSRYSCTLNRLTMCEALTGVLLAPGEAATVLADARICEQAGAAGIEVRYELGAPSLPCQGDVWLRGEFTADTLPIE